jgi:DNA mismatch endonuclease (patch repair protein)
MEPRLKRRESKAQRSAIMARVKSKNTTPEMVVRRLAFSLGYRYRLHVTKLPGKPDLVFSRRRKVIFVHGCFWHGHDCRAGQNQPASNLAYWGPKLDRNRARDRENQIHLKNFGWGSLVVWECEARDIEKMTSLLRAFLT